jgi:hypothetical protein
MPIDANAFRDRPIDFWAVNVAATIRLTGLPVDSFGAAAAAFADEFDLGWAVVEIEGGSAPSEIASRGAAPPPTAA